MEANEPDAQEYELSSRIIAKAGVSRTGQRIKGIEIAFDDDFANPGYADNRIGFGSGGFETFTLDIPDELRGKVSTLRFELGNDYNDEVYLDNVFFQSQHLQFGNPTDARIQYDPYPTDGLTENHNDNRENFLVEKPQYTISYNDTTKNPNWVSWQLNRSWLGAESRTNKFEQDHTLPSNWDKVQGDGDINKNIATDRKPYDRGHLAPSNDRTRNEKENYATFLMSNMVPQNPQNNQNIDWWRGLEEYSRDLVKGGKELYIVAGGQGQKSVLNSPNDYDINVPDRLWKVVVVMDKPSQTIADVDENTMAFAIDIPNIDPDKDTIVDPDDWKDYVIPVQTLENRLGTTKYDFLSNVPTEIQEKIEGRDQNEILNWINSSNLSSPLLAASDTSVGHDSFVEDNIFTPNKLEFSGSTQIDITEVSLIEAELAKSSIFKNSSSKVDFTKSNLPEDGVAKVRPFHEAILSENTFKNSRSTKISKTQVSIPERTSIKLGFTEVGFPIDSASDSFSVESSKTLSSEILFAPSVEPEQFFSIHNSKTNNVSNNISQADSDTISTDTSIGHDSFVENSILAHTDDKFFSASEVGITEIDILEANLAKSSVSENRSGEIRVFETDLIKNSIAKVRPFHKAILSENTFKNSRSTEISETQVSIPERTSIKLGFTEVGFPIDSASDSFSVESSETLPSEILFAPSIEPEQFFSVHNSKTNTNNVSNKINQADSDTISANTTIGQDSFIEDDFFKSTHFTLSSPSQVGITEIGLVETSLAKNSISENSSGEINLAESNLSENSIGEVNSFHVAFPKTTLEHTNSTEIGEAQVNLPEMTDIKLGITEVGIPINSPFNTFIPQSSKTLSSEILFAPSVEPEQFFSIHNSTPEITNVLNNTATNIWSDLLQPQTQLDINFQITDLPTGQLAEATITGFNDSGVPNTGTIAIDHDANGVGWFIDRTPLDNSEFIAQDTDSYLLAATESEANAKYDLLTTVLHELAHIYGFIDGYEGFDTNVETENGTTKFIGDDFEAVLDGEHLDKLAHPNDLMNTHLAPGIRKLPSELDVQILQAIQKAEGRGQKADGNLDAALTSDPLFAIANGDFSISDTTTWDTRGASDIGDIQAVLTEDSPFLSNFTQTFVEAGADLTIDEGSTVNLSGSFTDAGTEDTHTVAWDLGNGETTIQPMLLLPMPMDIKWSNFLPRCNFGLRSA
ncbi:MAG: DNA/RNA non-specific endonuclease [Cyanobacteria bacterium J06648_1]